MGQSVSSYEEIAVPHSLLNNTRGHTNMQDTNASLHFPLLAKGSNNEHIHLMETTVIKVIEFIPRDGVGRGASHLVLQSAHRLSSIHIFYCSCCMDPRARLR